MNTELVKHSPLSGVYRRDMANCQTVQGWRMAEDFGKAQLETKALQNGSVLVDWSHIGKLSLRGSELEGLVDGVVSESGSLRPLQGVSSSQYSVLRLTEDEFWILTEPGKHEPLFSRFSESVQDLTGALGCLVLAGKRRHEVMERSSAMNFEPRSFLPGEVLQTSIHRVTCTVYRRLGWDVILVPRELSHFLFDAFLDVGAPVGLVASGLGVVPVSFQEDV